MYKLYGKSVKSFLGQIYWSSTERKSPDFDPEDGIFLWQIRWPDGYVGISHQLGEYSVRAVRTL